MAQSSDFEFPNETQMAPSCASGHRGDADDTVDYASAEVLPHESLTVDATAAHETHNPMLTAGAVLATIGVAAVAAPVVVVAPVLAVLGFGSGGVVAGTAAAGIQASLGNVVAGSAFAMLQSAGAGGAGIAIVNGVVQISGAALALGGGFMASFR